MSIKPGHIAPPFALFDTEKKKISLADFRGQPVLILFFPLAFTSTCTKELCGVRDDIAHYDQLKVQVLGISVDSLFSLKKFKEEQRLNFPLLSDFNKEVSTAYDTIYPLFSYDMKGVSKRSAFVIDPDGIIVYAEILENAGEIPDFKAIEKILLTFA